jgi:hypothetical protein
MLSQSPFVHHKPYQTPHGLPWNRNRPSALKSRQLSPDIKYGKNSCLCQRRDEMFSVGYGITWRSSIQSFKKYFNIESLVRNSCKPLTKTRMSLRRFSTNYSCFLQNLYLIKLLPLKQCKPDRRFSRSY